MLTINVRRHSTARALLSGAPKLVFIVLLLGIAGTAAAVPILQTDASWRVTPTNPSGSWNTDSAFDDSGWQNATVLYDVGAITGNPDFAGTAGIWSSGGQFSNVETAVWIRKTFMLGAPLTFASLIVGCDDDCTVWVNGTQVINDTNGFANNSFADVLPHLTVGENLIAYTVTDNFLRFGFNHSTWLQVNGEFAAVPEPASLALLTVGIAGLWSARRRLRS